MDEVKRSQNSLEVDVPRRIKIWNPSDRISIGWDGSLGFYILFFFLISGWSLSAFIHLKIFQKVKRVGYVKQNTRKRSSEKSRINFFFFSSIFSKMMWADSATSRTFVNWIPLPLTRTLYSPKTWISTVSKKETFYIEVVIMILYCVQQTFSCSAERRFHFDKTLKT